MKLTSLSPNLYVADLAQSVAFYEQLGFVVVQQFPDEAPIFAMLQQGALTLLLQTLDSATSDLPELPQQVGASVLFYYQVEGVRAWEEKLRDTVKVVKPLHLTFYGATEFTLADPDGYLITLAEDE